MADNFAFTEGSGKTGAADDIGGVLYPRVKAAWGPDGTANDVDTASGKALPVQLRDSTGTEIVPLTTSDFDTKIGSLTETAPTTDTASSGLNGRLQRIAQRLTTLIGSTIAVSGTFWQATQPVSEADGANVTLGAKADAKNTATDTTAITAMSVWKQISASVQAIATSVAGTLTVGTHAVTQSGTWTVQPGNTANTTAWKVDASSVAVPITDNSGSITVDNGGTFAVQATIGSGATAIAKAEDVASADADVGVPAMAIRKGTPANTSGTDGDYEMLQMSAGRLWVDASGKTLTVDGSGVTQPVSIASVPSHAVTNAGTFAVQATEADGANTTLGAKADAKSTATDTTAVSVMSVLKQISASVQAPPSQAVTNAGTFAVQAASAGDVAHDGVDSGNPVKVGGKATNVEPTAVSATGDRTNFITDMVGKLIVSPYTNPENLVSGAITSAMTGTTSTSLVAAPAAGLRNYITQITVSNSHATVGTDVLIQDGSGGTTLYVIPAAAAYGGASLTFPAPLRQPTTATAIYAANVTTGSSIKISASGYKGA
jgi:hypothetical protein